MIGVFESFTKAIKFRESFFEIPFVVSALNFDGEIDCIFLGFVFFEAGDCDLDG